jgi:uncharacterized protein DUF1003
MSRTATRRQDPGLATDAAGRGPGRSRRYIHIPKTSGERIADAVATGMGSWRFIIAQSVIVAVWVLINLLAFLGHWDPYPFILLNLLFSTQAAYAAPIIMMSQNRQAQKDRLRDDHEAEEVDLLYRINQQQLEILALLRTTLCPPDTTAADTTVAPVPPRPVTASEQRASAPIPRRRRR